MLVGGRRFKQLGPSPTLGSLGPSHKWCHKSRASLRGSCAHGVAGTPHGEVRDTLYKGWIDYGIVRVGVKLQINDYGK